MNVFNSLTRRNEELKPLENNTVRLYTCGPTVYNFAHIGNFRAYTFEVITSEGSASISPTVP